MPASDIPAFNLEELARKYGLRLGGNLEPGEAKFQGIFVDSREAAPGQIFAAMPGEKQHGAKFAAQLREAGIRAFLSDENGAKMIGATCAEAAILIAEKPRLALSQLAAEFYPGAPEHIIAVTGTNGKTSVASFVRQIWMGLGLQAVNFGTAGVEGTLDHPLKHTTPEPVTLHKLLSHLAAEGITHAAMEASSHGLVQYRLDGVRLGAAGFTNFSRDHLDYHANEAEYLEAKLALFARVLEAGKPAVINIDDPKSADFLNVARAREQKILRTGRGSEADLRIMEQRFREDGQDILLDYKGERGALKLELVGDFQAENLLVALGLVMEAGEVAFQEAIKAASRLETVRGRMQLAARRQNGAAVYVDYAHTPDALATAMRAIRPHVLGRLILVFGAGGDRDKGKRPLMGEAAREHADLIFVTDDNPRSEEPALIRSEIMKACPGAEEVGDRAEAILRAIEAAKAGDVVLIAGKGHETGQILGDQILPFDDVEQASLSVAALEGREV